MKEWQNTYIIKLSNSRLQQFIRHRILQGHYKRRSDWTCSVTWYRGERESVKLLRKQFALQTWSPVFIVGTSDYRTLLINQSMCSHMWRKVTINSIGFIYTVWVLSNAIDYLSVHRTLVCTTTGRRKCMHNLRSFQIHTSLDLGNVRHQCKLTTVIGFFDCLIIFRHLAKEWTHPVYYVPFMELSLTTVKRQRNNSENEPTQTTTTPRNGACKNANRRPYHTHQ